MAERAMAIGVDLIGVNNRDLKTFTVDLATTERLAARLTDPFPLLVAESGIQTRADVIRLVKCGAKAVLVGEGLMRNGQIRQRIAELLGVHLARVFPSDRGH
jgi:indole-3-glycerol phosphate synthase